MKKYKDHSLEEYLQALSVKTPAPGGGSAAALTAALGAALISMAAHYSLGKNSSSVDRKLQRLLTKSERLRKRFLELVDLDAAAYLAVVQTRKSPEEIRAAALKKAAAVPREVGKLCFEAIQLAPFLATKGNKHLLSDVEVAVEFLLAAFKSAMVNVRVNQG